MKNNKIPIISNWINGEEKKIETKDLINKFNPHNGDLLSYIVAQILGGISAFYAYKMSKH